MAERYMTGWSFEAQSGTKVDREKGIIYNAAIVTVGPAKGHGVELEREFIEETARQGNALKNGLKMRYGHPTMSSTALGTFLGRAKNFRVDDSGETPIARADLFLSTEAKDSPQGDLYSYVLGMAESEPDMFGLSIVFKPGKKYQLQDGEKIYEGFDDDFKTFVEMKQLTHVDFVDDPAANDSGLFSSFDSATIAGQVSEFLDTHPQVWELLEKRPDIFDLFSGRYREYLERKGGTKTVFDAETITEELTAVADSNTGSVEPQTKNEDNTMSDERKVFSDMKEKFGAEIAATVFEDGGSMEDAQAMFDAHKFDALKAERDALQTEKAELAAQVDELNAKLSAITDGGEAIDFDDAGEEEAHQEPEKVNCFAKIKEYQEQGLSANDAQNKVLEEYPEEFKAQCM
jgi:hypothetical protein